MAHNQRSPLSLILTMRFCGGKMDDTAKEFWIRQCDRKITEIEEAMQSLLEQKKQLEYTRFKLSSGEEVDFGGVF